MPINNQHSLEVSSAFNSNINARPVALVAPLDWGLGHASRCIPIINHLLTSGYEVIIASEMGQTRLLQAEFPTINFVNLPGYRIKYAGSAWLTTLKIILQIPKILIRIKQENKWLRKFSIGNHVDLVLSDNRFGFYHPQIKSVFITHQLYIITPFGHQLNGILQRINYYFINRFAACWIPDSAEPINLSGALSHPSKMPLCNTNYVGILSRINKETKPFTNKLLLILSGPEPQRSLLEKKLLTQIYKYQISAVMVRGLPERDDLMETPEYLKVYNHLKGSALSDWINKSEIVLARSGYSSIMDLIPIGKHCIFIPTPNQQEQEYLAKYLSNKGWACTARQKDFNLKDLILQTASLQLPDLSHLQNDAALKAAIASIHVLNTSNK